jgi:type VII secretion integral membrane protein EccD
VCVQTDRDGDPVAVDLALPSGATVGDLLPAIVDLVDDRAGPDGAPRRWRLHHPSGGALEWSLSLPDNGIRDGDLLILESDRTPRFTPMRVEPVQAVLTAGSSTLRVGDVLPGAVCVLTVVLASTALAWTAGSERATTSLVAAVLGAVAAAVVTMATGYPTASNVAVVSLTCAAGFLAVPSGPAAPNAFLAATAALSACLLTLRLSGRRSPAVIAIAAVALLTAFATVVTLPVPMVAAALAISALALLALAPRISLATVGLGPDQQHGDCGARAAAAHATLSGLVTGAAAAATIGAVVIAVPGHGNTSTYGVVALTALIGIVLLLRARTFVDAGRGIPLLAGGAASIAASLYVAVGAHPDGLGPAAGGLIAIGLIAVRRPALGATVARTLDKLEYAVLAAVVPVGCWAAGVYDVVGGFGLP